MLFPDCFKSAEICDRVNGFLLDRWPTSVEMSHCVNSLLDIFNDEIQFFHHGTHFRHRNPLPTFRKVPHRLDIVCPASKPDLTAI